MNQFLECLLNDLKKLLVGVAPLFFPQAVLDHLPTGYGRFSGEAFDGERSVSGRLSLQ